MSPDTTFVIEFRITGSRGSWTPYSRACFGEEAIALIEMAPYVERYPGRDHRVAEYKRRRVVKAVVLFLVLVVGAHAQSYTAHAVRTLHRDHARILAYQKNPPQNLLQAEVSMYALLVKADIVLAYDEVLRLERVGGSDAHLRDLMRKLDRDLEDAPKPIPFHAENVR